MTHTKARHCGAKRRHSTYQFAAEHLATLIAAGASEDTYEIYLCRGRRRWRGDTEHYHVGHRRHAKRRSA